jgi:hypothetical protein
MWRSDKAEQVICHFLKVNYCIPSAQIQIFKTKITVLYNLNFYTSGIMVYVPHEYVLHPS